MQIVRIAYFVVRCILSANRSLTFTVGGAARANDVFARMTLFAFFAGALQARIHRASRKFLS